VAFVSVLGFFLAAIALPAVPHFSAPFPRVISDAATIVPVAPGVAYGAYEMLTADGPLSVHVIGADLQEPTVRVGSVLASDRLISQGEPVSSMAHRTGAIAGINADYFDINQTNEPLNILIAKGRLIRAPTHRWAIAFGRDRTVRFAEFHNGGTLQIGGLSLPLETVNDWPPPGGGTLLLTPEFGGVPAAQNTTVLALQPTSGSPPFATYTVRAVLDNTVPQPPGYYLVAGPSAYTQIASLAVGDTVAASSALDPPIDEIETALGGGPLLVKNGAWYADPDGPSSGEFLTHMPASGVGMRADGKLLLFEIDGRQPALSIGVLQPQFAALMIGFGVVTGMQFDGGGSSTILARMPGDAFATVRNSPSDGVERRVADGLFLYSDAAYGPAARLIAQPQMIRALPGAQIDLRAAITDAGGHPAQTGEPLRVRIVPAGLAHTDGRTLIALRPGNGRLEMRSGALAAEVPIRIAQTVARIAILPLRPTVAQGGSLQLSARAYDRDGFPIALPGALPWSARNGSIDSAGRFRASGGDAIVRLQLGSEAAAQSVLVGQHIEPLPLSRAIAFATVPKDGPGGVSASASCAGCETLRYDFSGIERAAYLQTSLALPAQTVAVSVEVYGDGNGETLRGALYNAIDERFLYTFARIDWRGWRRVQLRVPAALVQPVTLKALYVINRVNPQEPAVRAAGAIALRNLFAVVAGSGSLAR